MKTWLRETPMLFDDLPPPVATGNIRQTVIDAALKKAHEKWKQRYEQFILNYADVAIEPFSAEDVRLIYLSRRDVPKTDKDQASGAIFQKLVRRGDIVPCGVKRSKIYGNMLTTYKTNR